ncbi:MAG TPA: ABC transporter substrate-binding protein [Arsenicitalea sp.]|nr:ABC transporter substrate-binding protein [Arsenicitalea sp.]
MHIGFIFAKRMAAVAMLGVASYTMPALAFQDSPELEALVKAGTLPPVEQRLPEQPLVVPGFDSTGTYGGTFRTDILGGTDRGRGWLERAIGYERLVRWSPKADAVLPDIAQSIDISPDSTTYTFHLRKGMKWSDGSPLTADDFEFWYNEVALNKELAPSGPTQALLQAGKPAVFKKIDEYTISYSFPKPYGLFLQSLASGLTGMLTAVPATYAKQFHKDFNPKVDDMVKAAGLKSWVDLFYQKVGAGDWNNSYAVWSNPQLPTLNAWVVTTPYDGSSNEIVAKRNPYYFKVDSKDNQLPYMDAARVAIVSDAEVVKLMIVNGQLDWVYEPQVLGVADKPVLFDNQDKGKYHFVGLAPDVSAAQVIHLNLTDKDPVKNAIFNQKDFRIALSEGINRQEIIDLLYAGLGEPWSLAPRPESPYYDPEMAKLYTQFDPAHANALLDGLGYTKRDGDGYRLGPDGKRISVNIDVRTTNPLQSDGLQVIVPRWKAIGIELKINSIDTALYQQRQLSNTFDAASNNGAGGLMETMNPRMYVPINQNAIYGIPWAFWHLHDPRGIEPPQVVKDQLALYDEFVGTADPANQKKLFTKILQIAKDQFRVIGINLLVGTYAIASNRMGNIPDSMIDSAVFPTPAPLDTSTWYIKQ